jgi:hypothetical protein
MEWVVRYARHCGFKPAAGHTFASGLRARFGPAAWRVLCRSGRAAFLPILRNRDLSLDSLVAYCYELARRSFVRAPRPELLAFFVLQRRLYFTHECRIPEGIDYAIMRIADREAQLRAADVAHVTNWQARTKVAIEPRMRWATLVERARQAAEQVAAETGHAQDVPWHFYCGEVAWRGLTVKPLVNRAELWHEGAGMRSCLYALGRECEARSLSRFFSVSRGRRRVATLELALTPPEPGFVGMDRELGRWVVKDLRLAYNRLPDTALVASMKSFAKMYNDWSKRPRRWPEKHAEALRKHLAEPQRRAQQARLRTAIFQSLQEDAAARDAAASAVVASGAASVQKSTPAPQPATGHSRMTMSREEMEAAARARGIRIAGPDHPVYREGPTIIFASSRRSPPGSKVVDLPYSDLGVAGDSCVDGALAPS